MTEQVEQERVEPQPQPALEERPTAPKRRERRGASTGTVIAIVAVGVVLSLVLGCLGGAAAGFMVSRGGFRGYMQQPFQFLTPQRAVPVPAPRTTPERRSPGSSSLTGALVRSVEAGSPAALAGIQPGDVMTAINGTAVTPQNPLDQALKAFGPGDEVSVALTRGSEQLTVKVKLGANPADKTLGYLGLRFSMVGLSSQ
jgi:membrane-associated protease RseP (regulator of RpoE activity)